MDDANGKPLDLGSVVDALTPVETIICPEPTSATHQDSFEKGCPLSPSQIRKMQKALATILATIRSTVTPAPVQPIRDQFNSLLFETKDGEKLAVCMRDSGYEFNYQGVWYEAKDGKVAPLGNLHISEVVQPSAVVSREELRMVVADWVDWDWGLPSTMDMEVLLDNLEQLQLPPPVAPVAKVVDGLGILRYPNGSISVDGVSYTPWLKNAWRGTPEKAVKEYETYAEMVPACAYDCAVEDRNGLIRRLHTILAQLPGVEVVERIVEALNNAWDSVPGQSDFSDPLTITTMAKAIAPIIEAEVQRRMDGVERYTANVSKGPVRRSGVVIFVDDLTPKGAKHE